MKNYCPIKSYKNGSLDKAIKGKNPFVIVIIDDWCPACQEYKPIIEFMSEKYYRDISFFVLRTDEIKNHEFFSSVGNIDAIPCSFFYIGNTQLLKVPGSIRIHDFQTAIQNLIHIYQAV